MFSSDNAHKLTVYKFEKLCEYYKMETVDQFMEENFLFIKFFILPWLPN